MILPRTFTTAIIYWILAIRIVFVLQQLLKIELHPSVVFFHDNTPTQDEFARLQHRAHEACSIANSLANCVKVITIAHFETTEHFGD